MVVVLEVQVLRRELTGEADGREDQELWVQASSALKRAPWLEAANARPRCLALFWSDRAAGKTQARDLMISRTILSGMRVDLLVCSADCCSNQGQIGRTAMTRDLSGLLV